MAIKNNIKSAWDYLQRDTWDAWLVSLVLIVLLIKFVIFPLFSLLTGTPLPLVVVESCSMYHSSNFENWWSTHGQWYESNGISKQDFISYSFTNGINKGDIILVWGKSSYNKGDIIIFNAGAQYPLIHRIVSSGNLFSTKGDNNGMQLSIEKQIREKDILGKAVARIPYLGWVKLIFYDIFKNPQERGLCS